MKPQIVAFQENYSDGSGVEFSVGYGKSHREAEPGIMLEHVSSVEFPVEKLQWLIDCLISIRDLIEPSDEEQE